MSRANKHNKQYITASEWKESFGGKKVENEKRNVYRKLPYYCCSLSFQPFEDPVCAVDPKTNFAYIFDIVNIVPYVQKHKQNPVTGEPLKLKDLIKLKFHKNAEGQYDCPVTSKVFTDYTHIVAVKKTGNVYAHDAIDKLVIKMNAWKDPLTDEPITKEDIITIQDPHSVFTKTLNTYHHLKSTEEQPEGEQAKEKAAENINASGTTERILKQVKDTKAKQKNEKSNILYTNQAAPDATSSKSTSFTSTTMSVKTKDKEKKVSESEQAEQKRAQYYQFLKKKKNLVAYVTLHTSFGDLNFELFVNKVPKTCENFLGLCEKEYYNDTMFHRLIPGFMIQGGDPTGKGTGGESLWGKQFADEFHPHLKHDSVGTLSMANSGKNTNKSQFFITFKDTPHLDNKHTVFGRLVGGLDILKQIETIKTTKDKPITPIKILKTTTYNNPFTDAELLAEFEAKQKSSQPVELTEEDKQVGQWYSAPAPKIETTQTGVGKYMKADLFSAPSDIDKLVGKAITSAETSKPAASSVTPDKKRLHHETMESVPQESVTTASSSSSSTQPAKKQRFGLSNW